MIKILLKVLLKVLISLFIVVFGLILLCVIFWLANLYPIFGVTVVLGFLTACVYSILK